MGLHEHDERRLGATFGIITIAAALAELYSSGVNASAVFGTIKDISGTLVAIIVFFTIMNNLRKTNNFRGSIEDRMNKVIAKYNPLVIEEVSKETDNTNKKNKLDRTICYGIASSNNVLFGGSEKYIRFLEIASENPDKMEFLIRKTYFGDTESNPYNPEELAERIVSNLKSSFNRQKISYRKEDNERYRVVVSFNEININNEEGVDTIIDIIEKVLLLYVILGKKQ